MIIRKRAYYVYILQEGSSRHVGGVVVCGRYNAYKAFKKATTHLKGDQFLGEIKRIE